MRRLRATGRPPLVIAQGTRPGNRQMPISRHRTTVLSPKIGGTLASCRGRGADLHPLRQDKDRVKRPEREPEAMKSLIVPLAVLSALATAGGPALAAPPAYCALYAREYANQFAEAAGEKPDSEPKIQDEAYYRCLNMDQEPQMPATSAYYGTSVDTAAKDGEAKPAPARPATDMPATVSTASTAPAAGSTVTAAADGTATAGKAGTQTAGGNADPSTAAAPSAPAPQRPTQTADISPAKRSYIGNRIQPWTPAWRAACHKYFPHSFDEKDGTILPHGATKRVFCQ